MKILAAYPYLPESRTRVRSYETLKLLAGMGDLTVVFADRDGEIKSNDHFNIPGEVVMIPDSLAGRAFRVLGALAARKTITYAFYRNAAHVFAQRHPSPFDLVFVERLTITKAVKSLGRALIYDAVDSFDVQTTLLAQASSGLKRVGYNYDSKRIMREQVEICNNADGILCTTLLEQRRLRDAGVSSQIHAYLHTSQVTRPLALGVSEGRTRPLAVFHGRGSYAANQAAGLQIRFQIAPAVPGTDFLIFGADWPHTEGSNLLTRGFQKDLSLLWSADFAIFPLGVAVGVQNKVIEALAAGLPCIVTPIVAEGLPREIRMGLKDRLHVIRLEEFAHYISDNSDIFSRSEMASYAFERIYINLVAAERSALVGFIDETLVRKGFRTGR